MNDDLRAGVALPLLRREGGDGLLRGGGVARQDLHVSVATRLHRTKISGYMKEINFSFTVTSSVSS